MKMEKEIKTLSECRCKKEDGIIDETDFIYWEEDVKEYIQVIMQNISFLMNNSDYTEDDIMDIIEKRAGDKLIEERK